MAMHDPLTGLANRSALDTQMTQGAAPSRSGGHFPPGGDA